VPERLFHSEAMVESVTGNSMRADHVSLLKTLSLVGVILFHAALPFTAPGGFWQFYADRQSLWAEGYIFWSGLIVIPSFMLASGYLAALSEERRHWKVVEYLVSRVRRLLVPWFLLMVFWMVPLYTLFDIPVYNRPEGFSLAQTYRVALMGLFADHLWFLLVLFWVDLLWVVAIRPVMRRFGAIVGLVLAFVVALLIREYGRGLIWYSFWQADGPLVWFVLGSVLFRCRERFEGIARHLRVVLFAANVAFFVVLARSGAWEAPVLYWLVCGLGALAAFQGCLGLVRHYERLRRFWLYRFFEDNSFRFYLFHMPGTFLCFMALDALGVTAPVPFVMFSFVLNFCLTMVIVMLINLLESGGRDQGSGIRDQKFMGASRRGGGKTMRSPTSSRSSDS
jgi:peptidoglycan/LPS O-acetylase OafA/YrhL